MKARGARGGVGGSDSCECRIHKVVENERAFWFSEAAYKFL